MKWSCGRCTFINEPASATCEVCYSQRPPVRVALSGQTITERIAERQKALEKEEKERRALLRVVAAAEAAEAEAKAAAEREVGFAEAKSTLKEFFEDQSCDSEVQRQTTAESRMRKASTWETSPEWSCSAPATAVFKPDKRHGIGQMRRPMPPTVYNEVGKCPKCGYPLQAEQIACRCGTLVGRLIGRKLKFHNAKATAAWVTCEPDATPWRSLHDQPQPSDHLPSEEASAEPETGLVRDIESSPSEAHRDKATASVSEHSDSCAQLYETPDWPRTEPPREERKKIVRSVKETRSTLSFKDLYDFFGGACIIYLVGLPQSGKSFLAKPLGKYAGFTIVRKSRGQSHREFLSVMERELKRAANASKMELSRVPPRIVIDAENTREKERQALWRIVVEKNRIQPSMVKFLVLVPTRSSCEKYIDRLMESDRCSYREARDLIRSFVDTFEPISRRHITTTSNVLTLFNDDEVNIVKAFIKSRLAEFCDETLIHSLKVFDSMEV